MSFVKAPGVKLSLAALLCFSTFFLIWGCQKSAPKSAEQVAIERHQQEVQREKKFRERQPDQKERKELAKLPWTNAPAGPATEEAIKFLTSSIKSGQLQDIENASPHVFFKFDPLSTNYPITRTFYLKMKYNDPFVNHYTVAKANETSPWQLKKAWRTDAGGKIVKQYPVQ